MCPGHGPTLFFDVAALLCGASLQALSEPPVIDPLDLRNLRNINSCTGLTKCRDRHGQARPIICVSF